MEVISAFIALNQGYQPSTELARELIDVVRHELGPVAVIGEINFVSTRPKTRSGKIMRRVLRAVTLHRDPGDISTIEDDASVGEARHAWEAMRQEIGRLGTGPDTPGTPREPWPARRAMRHEVTGPYRHRGLARLGLRPHLDFSR